MHTVKTHDDDNKDAFEKGTRGPIGLAHTATAVIEQKAVCYNYYLCM